MLLALRNLVLGTLVLIAALIVGGFFLPDTARVERSVYISAPPSQVFAMVNDFERFNSWSPWAQMDPKTQFLREGPDSGVGARQAWLSENPSVGSGSHEIVESVPNERVRMKLDYTGVESTTFSTFLLAPEGQGTKVTWVYESSFGANLLHRYFGLLLDRMVGDDYERGLAALKQKLEQPLPQ